MCGNFVVELILDFLSTWWATFFRSQGSRVEKLDCNKEEENGKDQKSANEHILTMEITIALI